MLRKIHTSQGRRRFYHQQHHEQGQRVHAVTRPPTSHPYSSLRHLRSYDTIQNCNFFGVSKPEKEDEYIDVTPSEIIRDTNIKQSSSMPKTYAHMLTQIRILFRGRQKKEEKIINSLLGSLSKKISQLYLQNNQNKQKVQSLQQELLQIQQRNEELMNRLKKNQTGNIHNQICNKQKAKSKNYELVIENLKLAQLNEAYLNKIHDLQSNKKEKHVQIKKEQPEQESTEVLRHLNRISYLEMKLKNSEQKEAELNTVNQTLQKNKAQLENKIADLNEQKVVMTEKMNQWRQRANMQMEDSEMHLTRQNFLLYSIKKLRQINKGLTQKLLNKNGNQGIAIKNQVDTNPYFQYEVDFFKSIKTVYFDSKYKDFKMSLTSKKQETMQLSNFELEQEYVQYRKHEQINLGLYSYFMPKFYSFIEDSLTSQISNTRVKGNNSVSRVFIQIMRAILRSKLNQFLMYSEQKYSRFPQFVYTWFERFYFNSEKNDVATLEPYMQKPFAQDLFYRDLMNIKLDQSWEIITFRQFLLEQLSLEELYFYLMCQNLLFRKAGITKQKQYQGTFSILVEYNAAKIVLDMVLSDFESWNLGYLMSKMREKIIYKKNIEYIDSGFFLRCLVEYYKIQRINRYKYIFKLCEQFKSEEQGLRFPSFLSIINRFTEVSIDHKIRLYRECFCLGRGKITADVIFTVCSEKLIFLRYLKLKCFFKLPLLTTQANRRGIQMSIKQSTQISELTSKPIICVQPPNPYLYEIYTKMLEIARPEGKFYRELQKLGSIDLLTHFSQLQKIFNDKLITADSSILRCRHFMHYLSQIVSKIKVINFTNFYELLEEENKKKNNQSFWIDIEESHLCQILSSEFSSTIKIHQKLTKYIEWKNKVYDFRLHHAARKIQKMVKKKFIAPFMELYKIIYSEVKNGEHPSKA